MNNNNINYQIIEDIYINLFQKNNIEKEYIDNNIFSSLVPDYIENNESQFRIFNSNDYKNFILNLINQKTNNTQYIYKPSLLIIFKLINLFANEFDDKLIWLYNKTLHKIQNFDPNYYFQNKTGSSIYEFYKCNLPEEYFYEICWRLFYIEPKSYYLLVGELDWLDNNLNLNDNKFNNFKFNIFLGVLEQFKISLQSEIFDWFNSLIDLLNPPNPKSIKFSIYMGLYVYNKLLDNKQLDNIFININYDDSNINKFFTLLTLLDSKTFTTIFEYVDKLNNDIFINKNNNDINEIFDNNDNFIETPYDYKLKNKNNYLYDEVNKNEIKFNQHMIEVYGGGNNTDIKIPINPLNKIAKYVYYIKQNRTRTM
jgi:hypothetical protein